MLNKNKIAVLRENDFRVIYKTLWASRLWSNKDWYINEKLLRPNGLEKIKTSLNEVALWSGRD
jgi:hypothetical protein